MTRVIADASPSRATGFDDKFWLSGDGVSGTGRFGSLGSDFSVPGSRVGALARLGVPEAETQVYSEGVRRGGVLLVGRIDDSRTQEVLAILERHGPVDAEERGSLYGRGGWIRMPCAPSRLQCVAINLDRFEA